MLTDKAKKKIQSKHSLNIKTRVNKNGFILIGKWLIYDELLMSEHLLHFSPYSFYSNNIDLSIKIDVPKALKLITHYTSL